MKSIQLFFDIATCQSVTGRQQTTKGKVNSVIVKLQTSNTAWSSKGPVKSILLVCICSVGIASGF